MGWSGQEDGMDVMKEIIQKEIQSHKQSGRKGDLQESDGRSLFIPV